jgi:hypothetical protein
MKRLALFLVLVLLAGSTGFASPLPTSARGVIPSDVQQIICVDYRSLKNSATAVALKQRVLPDNLKQFETSLREIGMNPDTQLEQLTFASFRTPKYGLRVIGIAQGDFPTKAVLKKFQVKKIKPIKYRGNNLWPMASMQMTFLDDFTVLFGENTAIRAALDARDGEAPSLTYNTNISDLIPNVENGTVWSVLDQLGTQNLMHSALGDASQLADFESVKKRLLASSYTMDFQNGVDFDLGVRTSDSMTASVLSSLVQAGMMYRKATAAGPEKTALEGVTVNSSSDTLKIHFEADDKKFSALLDTPLFAAVSR